MPKGITNRERAQYALEGLRAHFSTREGQTSAAEILEDLESNMVDLVTDLMHLAKFEKVKFTKVQKSAQMHFNDET